MPIYRLNIETSLSTQEVLRHIRSQVRETPPFFISLKKQYSSESHNSQPFIGKVEGNTFRIRRDIRYRNSFLPRIYGQVTAFRAGSRIKIIMSLHPFVAIFMLFWLGGVSLGGFAIAHTNLKDAFIPLGMFIFGVALVSFGFFPEAIKARNLLEFIITDAQQDIQPDA